MKCRCFLGCSTQIGGQRRYAGAFWGEGRKIRLCEENSGHTGLNHKSHDKTNVCCVGLCVCVLEGGNSSTLTLVRIRAVKRGRHGMT